MACQLLIPAKLFFVGMYVPAEIEGVNGSIRAILLWKEVAPWLSGFIPIFGENVQGLFLQNCVAVRTVL